MPGGPEAAKQVDAAFSALYIVLTASSVDPESAIRGDGLGGDGGGGSGGGEVDVGMVEEEVAGDEERVVEKFEAVEPAVAGKYTAEVTATLPLVIVLTLTSVDSTAACDAICETKEALKLSENVLLSNDDMSKTENATIDVTYSTVTVPGGGDGGGGGGEGGGGKGGGGGEEAAELRARYNSTVEGTRRDTVDGVEDSCAGDHVIVVGPLKVLAAMVSTLKLLSAELRKHVNAALPACNPLITPSSSMSLRRSTLNRIARASTRHT
ncbi:hypothetical protein CYMTET_25098 [Cymbomonas tetramitiformis]|uniref:Uncharacterized protein n=1 Tax=Cymbomonas tetramitiformis TaxID=36881 RepID=A0AAE0FUJ3_9CHLO|nr:hypothetical protein CYMTET_25098 [Cymbomonas tetramitiformis]